jgi:hypothetical protein
MLLTLAQILGNEEVLGMNIDQFNGMLLDCNVVVYDLIVTLARLGIDSPSSFEVYMSHQGDGYE